MATDEVKGPRTIGPDEAEVFKRSVGSMNTTGFFSWADKKYTQYVPLYIDSGCEECEALEEDFIGVLKVKLATTQDFALLVFIQRLIWTLGLIAVLPLGALLVAGAIIREKNNDYKNCQNRLNFSFTTSSWLCIISGYHNP